MSMKMLTILQIAGILALYLGVSVALPGIVLHRKFRGTRLSARLMAYFMCGNFYMINLVFLLQLLHISYGPTLILGTLVPLGAAAVCRFRENFSVSIERGTRRLRLILEGETGIRTQLYRSGKRLSSGLLGERMSSRWPDVILTLGVLALVCYLYGTNVINVYGYCASDIVVHHYWINEMGNNNLFAAGIYPFGFHNVIYYLHAVAGIPTYVLLRVFCLVQTIMIHMMLLFFLRAVCRSRYAPYAGTFLYLAGGFFSSGTYARYGSSLPQEFGMLFLFPSAYFAISFFQERNPDCRTEEKGKKRFRFGRNLTMFAISVSMTLAVHFYDAIVAAVFCAGIAVGFCFRCFRWRYLRRIMLAGMAGVLLAVLPMAAAYMMGTPLQGSLYWGMSVMSTEEGEDEETEEAGQTAESMSEDLLEKAGSSLEHRLQATVDKIKIYVAGDNAETGWFLLGSTGAVLLLGIVWYIGRRTEYGGILVSVGTFLVLMILMQSYADWGIPQLIEISRCSIYVAYGFALAWGLSLDGIVFLLFRERKAIHLGSLAALAGVCAAVAVTGMKTPLKLGAQETNDAIICMSNILRENQDGETWTICSANDERQMMRDYGNHYELIDFLRGMEELESDTVLTVPTKTVYFFVEKVPIFAEEKDLGRRISREGAGRALPDGREMSSIYAEDARWVVMSRMYFWAQAFRRLYPNEMEVYYESEDFVCYRVRQNEYSLYNFAIDYGYNGTG